MLSLAANLYPHPLRRSSSRALCVGPLKKFEDLNADFLRNGAVDLSHPIPEPDEFALFLDIHWHSLLIDRVPHSRTKEEQKASPRVSTLERPKAP
jgi:hypothetical protein